MNIDLAKYALDRVRDSEDKVKSPGPVITISRMYGCPAKSITADLVKRINSHLKETRKVSTWDWISKEILEESAKKLKIDPSKLKYIFNYEEKSLFDEILAAQSSRYYISDKKIRNTIGNVLKSIAIEGNVIIVGRAGVVMTRSIKRSLHIKLIAPLEWRLEQICKSKEIGIKEAQKMAASMDQKRQKFIDLYNGKKTDDSIFDLLINCAYQSKTDIISMLFQIGKEKMLY